MPLRHQARQLASLDENNTSTARRDNFIYDPRLVSSKSRSQVHLSLGKLPALPSRYLADTGGTKRTSRTSSNSKKSLCF